jgi:predicted N-acetyltransferase YhbS
MKTPEELIPEDVQAELLQNFPAHLHTNLRQPYRGQGVGRELIDAFLSALSSQGVPGVHLHCGAGPIPFYEKCGFNEAARVELRPGVFTYALARKTS